MNTENKFIIKNKHISKRKKFQKKFYQQKGSPLLLKNDKKHTQNSDFSKIENKTPKTFYYTQFSTQNYPCSQQNQQNSLSRKGPTHVRSKHMHSTKTRNILRSDTSTPRNFATIVFPDANSL